MQGQAHEVESHNICDTPRLRDTICASSELQPHPMPPLFRLDVTIWGPERQPTTLTGNSSPVVPGGQMLWRQALQLLTGGLVDTEQALRVGPRGVLSLHDSGVAFW